MKQLTQNSIRKLKITPTGISKFPDNEILNSSKPSKLKKISLLLLFFAFVLFNTISIKAQTNVALNKATKQSGDFGDHYSEYAVDGDTRDRHAGVKYAHTITWENPWWEVDLGADYTISQINIFNVTDMYGERLKDLNIKVSKTPFNSVEDGEYFAQKVYPQPKGEYPGNVVARYVRLYVPRTDILNLCEVQVMGVPAGPATPPQPQPQPEPQPEPDVIQGVLSIAEEPKPEEIIIQGELSIAEPEVTTEPEPNPPSTSPASSYYDYDYPSLAGDPGNWDTGHSSSMAWMINPGHNLKQQPETAEMIAAREKIAKDGLCKIFTDANSFNDPELKPLLERALTNLTEYRFPAVKADQFDKIHIKKFLKNQVYNFDGNCTDCQLRRYEFILFALAEFVEALDAKTIPNFASKLELYSDFEMSLAAQKVWHEWASYMRAPYYISEHTTKLSSMVQSADIYYGKEINKFERDVKFIHPLNINKGEEAALARILALFTVDPDYMGDFDRTLRDKVEKEIVDVLLPSLAVSGGGTLVIMGAALSAATFLGVKAAASIGVVGGQAATAVVMSVLGNGGVAIAPGAATSMTVGSVLATKASLIASGAAIVLTGVMIAAAGFYGTIGKRIKIENHGKHLWSEGNMKKRCNWNTEDEKQRAYNFTLLLKYMIVRPGVNFKWTLETERAPLSQQFDEEKEILTGLINNPKISAAEKSVFKEIQMDRTNSTFRGFTAKSIGAGSSTNLISLAMNSHRFCWYNGNEIFYSETTNPTLSTNYTPSGIPLPVNNSNGENWTLAGGAGYKLYLLRENGDLYYRNDHPNFTDAERDWKKVDVRDFEKLSMSYSGSPMGITSNGQVFRERKDGEWHEIAIGRRGKKMESVWSLIPEDAKVYTLYGLDSKGYLYYYNKDVKSWEDAYATKKFKKVVGTTSKIYALGIDGQIYFKRENDPWGQFNGYDVVNDRLIQGEVNDLMFSEGNLIYSISETGRNGSTTYKVPVEDIIASSNY